MEKARWTEFNETTSSVHKSHIAHAHTHKPLQWLCMWSHARFIASRTQWPTKVCVILHISSGTYMPFRSFSIIHRFFAVLFYFFAISLPRNRSAARRQTFCRANNATHKCICCHAFSIYWPAIPKGKYPQAASSIASPPSLPPLAVSICCAIAAVRVRLTMIERLGISGNSHPHWHSLRLCKLSSLFVCRCVHGAAGCTATFLHTIYQLFRAFLAMNSEMLQGPLNCRTCTYVCA